jgi:hypothetical protein
MGSPPPDVITVGLHVVSVGMHSASVSQPKVYTRACIPGGVLWCSGGVEWLR